MASVGPVTVSVLIRTRDRPRLLAEALESVARQSQPPLEVVVVNDGGEPVSHILAGFARRLPIRPVTHASPHGRAAAANAGVVAAEGDWIALLDDDDLFLPDHLATLTQAARPNVAVVHARCLLHRGEEEQEEFGAAASLPDLLLANTIPTCTALVSRPAVLAVGGFDEGLPFLEDWDLWIRLARRYAFAFLPEVTSVYRAGPASVGGAMGPQRWATMEQLFVKHWELLAPAAVVRRLWQLEQDIHQFRRLAAELRGENARLREENRFVRELAEAGLLGPTWWLHRLWRRWRRRRG